MAETKGMSAAQRVADIRQHIVKAQESPLAARSVTLLAASKSQPREAIAEAYAAGIRDFGENRVQEAAAKWGAIRADFPDIRLHLIGPLQTNKLREAVALFDVIQTVDREKLALGLAAEMRRQGRALPCYIQVNTGEEPQKAGVPPALAPAFIRSCRAAGLEVAGLMCVPPAGQHAAPHFALLARLAQAQGVAGLSMGMSGDYETAVRLGATCIRLGRTLFGGRP